MANPASLPQRTCLRRKGHDYRESGAYFVTLCVQQRMPVFGEVRNGILHPSDAGRMVARTWHMILAASRVSSMDAFVVMPDHFHGIVTIRRGEPCVRPSGMTASHICRVEPGAYPHPGGDRTNGTATGSLGRIMQAFKSLTTLAYADGVREYDWPAFPGRLWQRNYWDRIIRDESELQATRRYIHDNPLNWHHRHTQP